MGRKSRKHQQNIAKIYAVQERARLETADRRFTSEHMQQLKSDGFCIISMVSSSVHRLKLKQLTAIKREAKQKNDCIFQTQEGIHFSITPFIHFT